MVSAPIPVHSTRRPLTRRLQHPAMPAQAVNQRKALENMDLSRRLLFERQQLRLNERAHNIQQELHHLGALSGQVLPGLNAAHIFGRHKQLDDVRRQLREMK